jgi:uncharacterized protein YcbK (DUF882 family)
LNLLASRAGRCGLAAAFVILGCDGLQTAVANGDTRSISLHHLHTNEDITITYKRDGKYDPEALKKLDWFVRDWRRGEAIKMDPALYDLIWEVERTAGSTAPIQVVCGYRAPATNAMLRRRSRGVAQQSQHMLGHAMDFYVPGVELSKLREIGMRMQRGGVGFYPTSGSPFVHMDTASVRHWPRMTHDQLVRLFPDGRTVHIPSDGVPLKNYALALADIERRGTSMPSATSLAAAREAGVSGAARPQKNLLAALFGAKDEEDEADATTVAAPANGKAATGPQLASAESRTITLGAARAAIKADDKVEAKAQATVIAAVIPLPPSRPGRVQPAVVAALTPSQIIAARGDWEAGAPNTAPKAARALPEGDKTTVARAETRPPTVIEVSWPVGDATKNDRVPTELALAYAAQPQRADAGTPMLAPSEAERGIGTTVISKAAVQPAASAKPTLAKASTQPVPTGLLNEPWTRAAMLAPDLHHYMSPTLVSAVADQDALEPLMRKPTSVVLMTFTSDPVAGPRTDRFAGAAVVFLPVVALPTQTAALQ